MWMNACMLMCSATRKCEMRLEVNLVTKLPEWKLTFCEFAPPHLLNNEFEALFVSVRVDNGSELDCFYGHKLQCSLLAKSVPKTQFS